MAASSSPSVSLCFHPPLFSVYLPLSARRPRSKLFLPLRAEAGKVKIEQAALDSPAVLRRPVVSLEEKAEKEEAEEAEEEEVAEEEEEVAEERRGGIRREWVDWEDTILEDTVPLVGFVRMILHSGKYGNGDRLSPEHEIAILERLLPFHPDYENKVGGGVDFIIVGLHPEFKSSRCLFVVRTNGEVEDFSFWKCLKGLIRKKYPLYAEVFIRKHFRNKKD